MGESELDVLKEIRDELRWQQDWASAKALDTYGILVTFQAEHPELFPTVSSMEPEHLVQVYRLWRANGGTTAMPHPAGAKA